MLIGHEPLCPGTTTTAGAWASRGAITPLRLPALKRWTDFGEVDRISLRQFYGWSANRRAKLCVFLATTATALRAADQDFVRASGCSTIRKTILKEAQSASPNIGPSSASKPGAG